MKLKKLSNAAEHAEPSEVVSNQLSKLSISQSLLKVSQATMEKTFHEPQTPVYDLV